MSTPRASVWRRRPGRVAGVVGAVLILVTGVAAVILATGERDEEPRFAVLPKAPNSHLAAAFPPALKVPGKCDGLVSRKTIAKATPKASTTSKPNYLNLNRLACIWSSNSDAEDVGGKRRQIQAIITPGKSVPDAMETFRRERGTAYQGDAGVGERAKWTKRWPEPESLAGIGDEALYHGNDNGGSSTWVTVEFRVRNLTVEFEYIAENYSGGQRTLPSQASVRGHAFQAAAEMARALGSTNTAEPNFTKLPAVPPIEKLPKPCTLVNRAALDRLGGLRPGSPARNPRKPDFDEIALQSRTETLSCGWYHDAGLSGFKVQMIRTPDEVPGMGADIAKHQHWSQFPDNRNEKNFSLLRGPGDAASVQFIDYGNCPTRPREKGCALVGFRVRNVLTSVWYAGRTAEGEPLRFDDMSRRAYFIATEVAKSLPR